MTRIRRALALGLAAGLALAAPLAAQNPVSSLPPVARPQPDAAPDAALDPATQSPPMLAGWMIGRMIWTEGTPADAPTLQDRPLGTDPQGRLQVGRIDDLVIGPTGQVQGYVADIGGFLGLGVRRVVLGFDLLRLEDPTGNPQFVTDATRAELEALPGLDASVLRK